MVEQLQYQINLDKNANESRSLIHLFTGMLCKECKKQYKAEVPSVASVLVKNIQKCCSKKTDYIHSGLPLKQAAYRTMLAKGNRPSTARQISDFLTEKWGESVYTRSMTPAVISRLLETSVDYEISVK